MTTTFRSEEIDLVDSLQMDALIAKDMVNELLRVLHGTIDAEDARSALEFESNLMMFYQQFNRLPTEEERRG